MRRMLACLTLAASAAACNILPEPPPPARIFTLRAAETAAPLQAKPAALTIAVARPNAVEAISGLDLVWLREGQINYLPRAAWTAPMPLAMQSLMVETIDNQNLVRAAIRAGEGPRPDFELRWEILAFQVEEGEAARLRVSAKLVQFPGRTIIAAREFSAQAPLAERTESAGAAALQDVARRVTAEMGAWAATEAIAQASAKAASTNR